MRTSLRLLGAALALFAAAPVLAAWPGDPAVNLAVCRAPQGQQFPAGAPSGPGAIACWWDLRGGANSDVYAQRVLASGAVDPAWPLNGLAVCTANADQQFPVIASDGADGALLVWCDARSGGFDLYAQHVLASGAKDPAWPVNGLALCTAPTSQWFPALAGDGGAGVLVAWHDSRWGDYDVYVHHLLAASGPDPAWPANGLRVCGADGDQDEVRIVPDGSGGAIVLWEDRRGGVNSDLYAQHVLANGTLDPAWPADGLPVCTAAGNQLAARAVSDGTGGAIVAWQDTRAGSEYDVYAQRVLAGGTVDPAWPADGLPVCVAASNQVEPRLVPGGAPLADGSTGAIVVWTDYRGGAGSDVYAHHLLPGGTLDPEWPAWGRVLCAAPEYQYAPDAVADGAGGAIVTWTDGRDGADHDVYAQHLLADGTLDPAWPANGRAVSTAAGDQQDAVIVAVPAAGGAGSTPIVFWNDTREGNFDVYAQLATPAVPAGMLAPAIFAIVDTGPDQGGFVDLSWNASSLDVAPSFGITDYRVWRSAAGGAWQHVATRAAKALPTYTASVPTLADSTGEGVPWHAFVVEARGDTLLPSQSWYSAPDSGWSADDLAPAAPGGLWGDYADGMTMLRWNAGDEPDVAGYRIYRGVSAGFVPGPQSFVAATAETSFFDSPGVPYAYKLTTTDVHGNESPHTTFLPATTTGAGAIAPARPFLEAAGRQPARGAVALRFGLSAPARARLVVFDAAGRRVRGLVDAPLAAGSHALAWDARDESGRRVAPGLYFARLEAAGAIVARRIVLTD